MANKIWIDNGVNVNPDWYGHIAVSYDGTNWTTLNKEGLSVKPRFKRMGITNPASVAGSTSGPQTMITLSDFAGSTLLEFECNQVQNQATWNGGTTAAQQVAVDDITTWIGELYNPGGSANQQEFMEVLIQDSLGDLYFMVRTLDEATGVYGVSYINADGTAATPTPPLQPYGGSSAAVHAEDTPHTTGDFGVQMLGVRNDAIATLTDNDGDYSPIATDEYGQARVIDQFLLDRLNEMSGDDNDPKPDSSVMIAGKAVDSKNYNPAYATNDVANPAIDEVSGRLLTDVAGNVGGLTKVVSSTVVMSVAGVYDSGDYMGTTTTPQAFSAAALVASGSGVIKSLVISDKIATANVAMELWLFKATFVAPTDNALWAISDAENLNVIGVIPIDTDKWRATANNQNFTNDTISLPFKLDSGQDIYYALVARGTTPSFTSADLTLNLGILQDA